MQRLPISLKKLRLTQALVSGIVLFLVLIFILPTYPTSAEPSSLSIVQVNDSSDAGVSGYNINYVEDHGDDYDPNMEEFVATNEWQQVKHGQAIPRGLHIRMNLQTGVKEAKLLDPEDRPSAENSAQIGTDNQEDRSENMARLIRMKENLEQAMKDLENQEKSEENLAYWKDGEKEGMMNMGKESFSKEELKEALKKFKANRDDVQNPDQVKEKFRSMEELKEDMEFLNMDMKTDVEILRELVTLYKNESITEEGKLNILSDLEYYVHQIDNAIDLIDMGGMDLVIKDLNNTNESIRSEAAFVIGSASQSNPKVQIYLLDTGVMPALIRMLQAETSGTVRNRILYAISSLLRQFPFAQGYFLEHGGLQSLASVFEEKGTDKLRLKASTLINDLVTEQTLATTHLKQDDPVQKEKLRQYHQIALRESLFEHGWCERIPTLLDLTEHDAREKILVAMTTLMHPCKRTFISSLSKLTLLQTEYSLLSQEEIQENSDDMYYTSILHTLERLIGDISAMKDEL